MENAYIYQSNLDEIDERRAKTTFCKKVTEILFTNFQHSKCAWKDTKLQTNVDKSCQSDRAF